VADGDLPVWKARMVARETVGLSSDAAAYVDRHVAPVAHKVRPAAPERLVAEAIGRFMPHEVERLAAESWDKRHVTIHDQLASFTGTMRVEAELDIADALDFEAAVAGGADECAAWGSPEPLDVRRAQAVGDLARRQGALDLGATDAPPRAVKPRQVVLHVHLSEAALFGDDPVAHLERGNSVVSVEQVRTWYGHPDAQVVVKPLLDLARCLEVDSDGVPDRLAEQVALRDRTCVFPGAPAPPRETLPTRRPLLRRRPRPAPLPRRTYVLRATSLVASTPRRHPLMPMRGRWAPIVRSMEEAGLAAVRRRFLDERRAICEQRMDSLHAPIYDQRWGSYINPTHRACVDALLALVPPGGLVLDAACGTGKYWPMILDAGLQVVGADQSAAMLKVAQAKHPGVRIIHAALQNLRVSLPETVDALICIDALENIGPEDWPVVLDGLASTLRPGSPAYVTVELREDDIAMDPEAITAPLVEGEVLEDGAYHFYPQVDTARSWLTEHGFTVTSETEGDGYHHFLLTRS
jgi:SAM-dependent methyltransferase